VRRETRTVELMIGMHCRATHGAQSVSRHGSADPLGRTENPEPSSGAGKSLCPECIALLEYSRRQVDACRFGAAKPVCSRCPVHCFRSAMRERVRAAMRYSGPRMIYRHPYLAMRHLLDRRREPHETGSSSTGA
jgi:Nitrous oxide-stimulated promoter